MLPILVFATNNAHKLEEVRAILGDRYAIKSLEDIGCTEDIDETGTTFQENALIKSRYVYETYGLDSFSDDSGLSVNALNGEPGVYSARYSGSRDADRNLDLVLQKMSAAEDRSAAFITVIALVIGGQEFLFEGKVTGQLRDRRSGFSGFGYDPIFQPDGYADTFAEMPSAVKNTISHRAIAVQHLLSFLAARSV